MSLGIAGALAVFNPWALPGAAAALVDPPRGANLPERAFHRGSSGHAAARGADADHGTRLLGAVRADGAEGRGVVTDGSGAGAGGAAERVPPGLPGA